jgi:hypothetical protein
MKIRLTDLRRLIRETIEETQSKSSLDNLFNEIPQLQEGDEVTWLLKPPDDRRGPAIPVAILRIMNMGEGLYDIFGQSFNKDHSMRIPQKYAMHPGKPREDLVDLKYVKRAIRDITETAKTSRQRDDLQWQRQESGFSAY